MSDNSTPSEVTLDELKEELESLQKQNEKDAVSLSKESMPINPYMILSLRLDTLLDSVLDPRNRINFEINYEQNFAYLLNEMKKQLNHVRLTDGVTRPSGSKFILP